MHRFIRKTALFAVPLFLWTLFIVFVDPFNYFGLSHLVPDEVKIGNAKKLNNLMYNIFEHIHNPAENIVVGDSRVENIPLEYIEEISGARYSRLNSNALKLNEAVDLFWLAEDCRKLENIYIGLNFNMYNQYAYADRVGSVRMMINNPLIYIFDRSVAKAAFVVIRSALRRQNVVDMTPPMTREKFWNLVVKVRANDHFGKYRYPADLYRRMKEMVEYARARNINIVFFIIPHHTDFQHRIADYGLTGEMIRFKRDLMELGVPVIDFDYDNEITSDRGNFSDPIHYNTEIAKLIVEEVWRGPLRVGRLVTDEYLDSLTASAQAQTATEKAMQR